MASLISIRPAFRKKLIALALACLLGTPWLTHAELKVDADVSLHNCDVSYATIGRKTRTQVSTYRPDIKPITDPTLVAIGNKIRAQLAPRVTMPV